MAERIDRTMSPARAAWLGVPLTVALAGAVLVPFFLVWGTHPLVTLTEASPLVLLAVLGVSLAVHEAVHALGWYLASPTPRPQVKFGVNWRVLMPYAHATQALRARAYRIGVGAPGVALGVVPAVVGLGVGSATLSMWGAAMMAIAAGDLLVLASLRGVPAMALVQDHPTRVGCEVVEQGGQGA